jgi:hypothetical protein
MTTHTPTNTDDVIDSRDIIARIEELESDIEAAEEDEDEVLDEAAEEELETLVEELETLKTLADEASGSPDWSYGEALIRDSYFQDYAQELAEDCCGMPNPDQWPARCIDWEQAARELQMDYMSVDFDGVDYWIRA